MSNKILLAGVKNLFIFVHSDRQDGNNRDILFQGWIWNAQQTKPFTLKRLTIKDIKTSGNKGERYYISYKAINTI